MQSRTRASPFVPSPAAALGDGDGAARHPYPLRTSGLFRINGLEDHVHILTSLHPTVALADLVKAIKTGSSKWIKEEKVFPQFSHWQEGYGAFTHSICEKDALIEYIKNQEAHHGREDFLDEYRNLLKDADIEFDEKYLL